MLRSAFSRLVAIMFLTTLFAPAFAGAEETAVPLRSDPMGPGEGAPMEMKQAAILGLVEGLTEYLPISSTGHLILTTHALDLEREDQALDRSGQPLWKKPPNPATGFTGEPFTVKMAADTYSIAIQAGAIAAVVILYWRSILEMLAGLLGQNPPGLRLVRNLLIAFVPAAVVGLALGKLIDRYLFSNMTVVAALVVGAGLMFWADRRQRARAAHSGHELTPSELTWRQALVIGLFQCVSLWPGMSRSMVVIVGGFFVGLRPARAAEFSFLLGLVTLTAAAGYKMLGGGKLLIAAFGFSPLAFGTVVAAIAAAISVRWLVGYLTQHGLALFAWYRIVLAAVVVWLLV